MNRRFVFIIFIILMSLGCNLGQATPFLTSEETEEIHSGEELVPPRPSSETVGNKWELWKGSTRLRGANLHPCKIFAADECIQPITFQDIQELRELGANVINATYPGLFEVMPPYNINQTALTYMDNLVTWAENADIYVVLNFRSGPGRNEEAIHLLDGAIFEIWQNRQAQEAWIEMWRFTAERYKDSPAVIGYNLLTEPHPNVLVDPDGEIDPKEVYQDIEGTLMDWNLLAAEITSAIREVDSETPIVIDSLNWADAGWFSVLEPTGDSKTIYSPHIYDPDIYTMQEADLIEISYPDVVYYEGERIEFNRSWLANILDPVEEFSREHDVPIFVGEFGALRWISESDKYQSDLMELFENYGWSYAYYVWRGDEQYFDGFNMELGTNPDNHSLEERNSHISLFTKQWENNIDYPSTMRTIKSSLPLAEVTHWLYYIDVNLEDDTIDEIIDSKYDMVVIDYITSEKNNTGYPLADVINRLHNAEHTKLVIAYIDIGEAEDYRTYWQPDWGIGDPEWILSLDPDGWEGNYPVAYWWDEYQNIWLGEEGYLQGILDAGFDGVYLDWIEAYSDETVVACTKEEGVDPVQEMIWWVGDIADYTRAQDPDFIVIAQNAVELAENDEYVDIIDAIAQEQTWFDGGADNNPPGDCPLPRTEEDIDTEEYYDSLSPGCQRQFDDFPESTLHMSSEEYLYYLTLGQNEGLTIFTVDYALEPDNIAWIYETSRNLGFIPFVSNRALNKYVEPYP